MNKIQQTLTHIIELSKRLHESDENWLYETNEPVEKNETLQEHLNKGVILPEAYVDCMAVSNGFKVDFSSEVGYFYLEPIRDHYAEEKLIYIGRAKSSVLYEYSCLYFDTKSGEFLIEHERSKSLIVNFNEEVLVPVAKYLEQQLIRTERRHKLLEQQKDNPLRKYFDAIMEHRDNGMHLCIYPPLTDEEISEWEKTHVKLPETYRNWLLLTGECSMDRFDFFDLDHVFCEEVFRYDSDEKNKEYWYLATSASWGTSLILDPESGKLFHIDNEMEEPWTEIEDFGWILDEVLECLEDM